MFKSQQQKTAKSLLLTLSLTALAACSGGGGGNDTPNPDVSIVTPQTLFKTGGEVRISGKRLKDVTVGFGPQNLTPSEQTDTFIKVTLPAGSAGAKSIKLGQSTQTVTFKDYYTKIASGSGSNASCGLLPNKTVECWGYGFGDAPKPVSGLTDVTDIGLGYGFYCALLTDKTVKCWGENGKGQLGDNTNTARNTPAFVKNSFGTGKLSNVIKLALGWSHACALIDGGTVQCWGLNSSGQLGNNSTASTKFPDAVSSITNAKEITAGGAHTCAILTDNSVQCWGLNNKGQLGDNSTTSRKVPVVTTGLTAKAISAGHEHTCAVLTNNTAQCWGRGTSGQLGYGPSADRQTPTLVSSISNVASISAGQFHTCATLSNGKAKCWGNNANGKLGDNNTAQVTSPVDVVSPNGSGLLANVTSIVAAKEHTCATFSDKPTHCWGSNSNKQLGNGRLASSKVPKPIVASNEPLAARNMHNAKQVAAGAGHHCSILMDSSVKCWGENDRGQLGTGSTSTTPVSIDAAVKAQNITNAKEVAVGRDHTCTLLADKTIKCWGGDSTYKGELGDGNNKVSLAPVVVKGISNATQLSVADRNGCALLEGGSVKCWGDNEYAQVGDGTTTTALEPKAVKNLSNVTQVATSSRHSCALLKDKTVKCWGANNKGQLGVAIADTPDFCSSVACSKAPVTVKGVGGAGVLSNVTQIALGAEYACALLGDGSIKCWGDGAAGVLGNNSHATSAFPVEVSGISTARKLIAGVEHSCALLKDNSVKCWGSNSSGQLGDGSTTDRKVPVTMQVNGKVDDISAGANQTLLLQGSLVVPWGVAVNNLVP